MITATVIDELVVSLKLDPAQFTQGQQKALEHLRSLEQGTASYTQRMAESARRMGMNLQELQDLVMGVTTRIDRDGGRGLRNFFNAIEHPVAEAKRGLIDLATQSRRTGEDVSAGAEVGRYGLMGLAGSALIALTAFKGVQKVMDGIRETSRSGEVLRFAAGFAGVPVPWMSQLANVAYQQTGVDRMQTAGWLVNLRQQVEQYRAAYAPGSGHMTPWLQTLANLGVPFEPGWDKGTNEDITQRLVQAISNRAAVLAGGAALYPGGPTGIPAAAQLLSNVGAPELLIPVLIQGWTKLAEAMAKVAATTDHETESEHRVNEARRTVDNALSRLTDTLIDTFAPAIVFVLNTITSAINTVRSWIGGPGAEKLTPGPDHHVGPVTISSPGHWQASGKIWPPFEYVKDQAAGGEGRLSYPQVLQLAQSHGFVGRDAETMAAIVMAESGGDPNAVNPLDPYGGSFGLTQINAAHPGAADVVGNPDLAMQRAYELYTKAGSRFTDWSTYNSGKYLAYLNNPSFAEASRAAAATPAGAPGSPPTADTGGSFTPQPDTTPGLWQRVKNWWQGPSHQKGEAWTSEGLAWLHQGERVLSKTENEILTALLGSAAGFPGSLVAGGARQAAQTTAWPWVAQARNDLIRLLWPSFGTGEPWALQSAYYTMSPWLTGLMLGMSPSRLNRGEVDAIAARPDLYPAVTSVQRQLNAIRRGMISQMWSQTRNITNRGGNVSVGPILTSPGANPYAIGHAVADALRRERIVSTFQSGQE